MDRRSFGITALILIVLLFFGLNIVADRGLSRVRIDLTENNLFTLSRGTKEILRDLEEPITLTFFYTESLARGRPQIQTHGKRVMELLDEYRLRSGGLITVEVLEPEPFSEAEERATREGVAAIPVGGESLYLGLVGTNSTDGREVIRFFDPGQERFLEYELTRMIYKLANPERPTIAVLSALPLEGSQPMPGMPPQQQQRPWEIMRELGTLFEVEFMGAALEEAPDADLLLIVHPNSFDEQTLRAIDSYVIGGGSAVVFVDPLCEADVPPEAAQNPMAIMSADRSSDLGPLLEAWGVQYSESDVVANLDQALQGAGRDGRTPVPLVHYLGFEPSDYDQDDAVTGGLDRTIVAAAGWLSPVEGATTTFSPLIETTERSMLLPINRVAFFPDPQELVAEFVSSGTERVIAARVSGPATSAYEAEATPEEAESESEEGSGGAQEASPATGEINVIVVADADMLADRFWIQPMQFGQMTLGYQKLSSNGDFLVNAAEQMAGSSALINVRARGASTRPFTYVEEIRREAEAEYLAEAQRLQEKQRQTEQRLRELQQARPDQGELILSEEQEAELDQFREQLAETNAQLRQVNYNMLKDVENLGVTLRLINTLAAPALVAVLAIALGAYRVARRRADRRSMAGKG